MRTDRVQACPVQVFPNLIKSTISGNALNGKQGECQYTRHFRKAKMLVGVAPQTLVVAKSAQLRFRLRRKLRPLPCSSSPHATRSAGLARGPLCLWTPCPEVSLSAARR